MSRVIAITGSASGIGKATAELLTSRGDRVIGVDRRDADVVADLSTQEGCAVMARTVRELSGGRIDGVVANAGVNGENACAVNYFGVIDTLEHLRPLLAKSEAPRATVTASLAATFPCDMAVVEALENGDRFLSSVASDESSGPTNHYINTKHAIARWIRRAAPEWAGQGILLNGVGPGVVDTAMVAADETDASARLVSRTPLGRMARPAEIAEAHAFLVSARNSYIAGQIVYVDGGVDAATRPSAV